MVHFKYDLVCIVPQEYIVTKNVAHLNSVLNVSKINNISYIRIILGENLNHVIIPFGIKVLLVLLLLLLLMVVVVCVCVFVLFNVLCTANL